MFRSLVSAIISTLHIQMRFVLQMLSGIPDAIGKGIYTHRYIIMRVISTLLIFLIATGISFSLTDRWSWYDSDSSSHAEVGFMLGYLYFAGVSTVFRWWTRRTIDQFGLLVFMVAIVGSSTIQLFTTQRAVGDISLSLMGYCLGGVICFFAARVTKSMTEATRFPSLENHTT